LIAVLFRFADFKISFVHTVIGGHATHPQTERGNLNMKEHNHKSFQAEFDGLVPAVQACLDEITDDRRPWCDGQVGNQFLYGAAASFMYWLKNPGGRPSSLNEAIKLRSAAYDHFRDDEQFDQNAVRILESFKPSAYVTMTETEEEEVPDFVQENEAELEKREADEEAMLEQNLPALEGFLNGASYDYIDMPPNEIQSIRARNAIVKAFEAIENRVQQDVLFCGTKWKAAKKACNNQEKIRWASEGKIASMDRETVLAHRKAGSFYADNDLVS